ncbi:MAG: bifunctional precorrin-2 dehydrogenase/sirohydrochlorin ferrochelatase [Desulfobacterales bacterium]|jgi:precorrin-2 dehydrogenase/sirohydrochlorin ferrochelatase|nr:bifunctional precorrin-2 dehydrogenase/sirohydrochlorin ferrochelatase [Desulfobacterales bacterium]
MNYFPIQLDIRDRRCLVVGGGGVGTRKARSLIACGGRVTVVSPTATGELQDLAATGALTLVQREYAGDDLQGMFLVMGATDDEMLNRRIRTDAGRLRILCNIADRPEQCDFILPAVIERGDLVVTVSTSGRSPALAKKLRQDLQAQFGDEYTVFLDLMGAIRKRLLAEAHAPEAHKPIFERLVHSDMLAWIREGRRNDIDRLLAEILGDGWRADDLLATSRYYSGK